MEAAFLTCSRVVLYQFKEDFASVLDAFQVNIPELQMLQLYVKDDHPSRKP